MAYLRELESLASQGVEETSSRHLAQSAQVTAFQVRKDLALLGKHGSPTGYGVERLEERIRETLGLVRPWKVAIVGIGRLGAAIANYPNLDQGDFQLTALFDASPAKVGTFVEREEDPERGREARSWEVFHVDRLPELVPELGIDIGFITVPAEAAQQVATSLERAGVKGILNFAPTPVSVKEEVHVEPVDFLAGLTRVSFYIHDAEVNGGDRSSGPVHAADEEAEKEPS